MSDQIVKTNLNETPALLEGFYGLNIPVLMLGKSGIGKTSVVEEFARNNGLHLEVIHGSHYTPMDIMGVGVPDTSADTTRFLRPELFKRLHDAAEQGLRTCLFIDELTHFSPTMLALAMQLVQERRVAGHTLPDDCWVVCAGNGREDAGPIFNINHILTNRMAVLDVQPPTFDGWAIWAMRSDVAPEIVAYLSKHPQRLWDMQPGRLVNATPRQWEQAGRVLTHVTDESQRLTMMQALVGSSAIEAVAYLRMRDDITSIDVIERDPEAAPMPPTSNMAALFMQTTICSQGLNGGNVQAIGTYAGRFPPDLQVVLVRSAIQRDKQLGSALFGVPALQDAILDVAESF
jgi:MoxR-like ATPase